MNVVLTIDGRKAIPVRALPYVANMAETPDSLARACAEPHYDELGKNLTVRNRYALHSYGLDDDGFHLVPPAAYQPILVDLDCLTKKLKDAERIEFENRATWRREAVLLLPAGVFVWLDEFQKWFALTRPLDLDRVPTPDDDEITELRYESGEVNLAPLIPQDLYSQVMSGFEQIAAVPMVTADWNKRTGGPRVRLWEAVALSMGIDPGLVSHQAGSGWDGWEVSNEPSRSVAKAREFRERLAFACRNADLNGGDLKTYDPIKPAWGEPKNDDLISHAVNLVEFAAFARSWGWEIPPELGALIPVPENLEPSQSKRSGGDSATDMPATSDQDTRGMVAWQAAMLKAWPKIEKAHPCAGGRQAVAWMQEYGPADVFVRDGNLRDEFGWIDGQGNRQTTPIKTAQNVISMWRRNSLIPGKRK
jgi:hypothetical protein